jgi:hypothetical protein
MYKNTLLSRKCRKTHGCPENVNSFTVSQKTYKNTLFVNCTQNICSGSVHKHSVVQQVHAHTLYYHMVKNRDCKQNVIESNNLHNTINSSVT